MTEKKDPLDLIIAQAASGDPDAPDDIAQDALADGSEPQGDAVETDADLPKHWSEEERTKWGAIPPEHRRLVVDARKSIEAGFDQKFKAAAEPKKNWKAFKQVMAPLQPLLTQHGGTKLQVTQNLVDSYVNLVKQPDVAFEGLARSFAASRSEGERQAILARFARGLGFSSGAAKPQATEEYLDPVAGQQIAQLRRENAETRAFLMQQQTAQNQQRVAQAEQMIQSFAKDNPHFEEVRGDLEFALASPRVPQHLPQAERLKLAYEIACKMNPEVWGKVEAARKAEKAKQEADARRKEVDKSKSAARNPQGQFVASGEVTKTAKKSLDEIIKESAQAA